MLKKQVEVYGHVISFFSVEYLSALSDVMADKTLEGFVESCVQLVTVQNKMCQDFKTWLKRACIQV